MKLVRVTGAIHHQDEMNYRDTKQWQKALLPSELNEGYLQAQVRTSILASRVRDDAVRTLIAEFRAHSSKITMAASRDESNSAMMDMLHAPDELNERIGALLRTLDDADSERVDGPASPK